MFIGPEELLLISITNEIGKKITTSNVLIFSSGYLSSLILVT
jgi:hypothetical protein